MPIGRAIALVVIASAGASVVSTVAAIDALVASLTAGSLALLTDRYGLQRVLVVTSLAAAVAAYAAWARDRALAPPLGVWFASEDIADRLRTPVLVDGVLVRDAEAVENGARLLIDVGVVEDATGRHPTRGRVQAHVAGVFVAQAIGGWSAGRPFRAPMLLRSPQVWLNPGGPSAKWQHLSRPFHLVGSVKSASLVSVQPGHWWDEGAAAARAYVRQRTHQLFDVSGSETGAVVNAILIGDRGGLDEGVERRLQVAGTYHVIAISGGNVALLTMWSFFSLRLVMRSFRMASIMTVVMVAVYGWIVGGDPSVTRAVTAASVFLVCGLFGLVPAALDVLAVVAIMVVAADPLVVIEPGAWLSFGATFGIILFAARVPWRRLWMRRAPTTSLRLRMAALGLCGATLAAEMVLLPINAALFSRVGIAGLALNFVAIPMMTLIQISGALAVAVASASVAGAEGVGRVTDLAVNALIGSARLVEVLPWLSWRVPPSGAITIIAFYIAGGSWLWWPPGRVRRAWLAAWATSAVIVAFAPLTGLGNPGAARLRVTMVDVGQGESILVQFPTGHSMLVDAASRIGRFDLGDRIVARAVWASGVRRLDWLAVTHADLDHIGGAVSVAGLFRPREVWDGVPVPADGKRQQLEALIGMRHGAWRQLQQGDKLRLGSVDIDVLNPPRPDWERPRVRNEDSLVMRLRYGDVEIVLTGDIGEEGERRLVDQLGEEPRLIRVLKVAHHGSRTSSASEFLRRYRPDVALISAGRGNAFGHPSPDVVTRLEVAGARVFRTDRDGAIILETDGRELDARAMTGRTWTIAVWRPPA